MPRRSDKADLPGSSTAGAVMLLIAAVLAAFSEGRNWAVVSAAAGVGLVFTIIGSGRIYRPAVKRSGDIVLCRFTPTREGSFYLAVVGLPLMGFIPIAGATWLGRISPNIWLLLGIFLIALAAKSVFIFLRQARESSLAIDPTSMTVRIPSKKPMIREIPRGDIEEITASTAPLRNYDSAPATQITYTESDSPAVPRHVVFGPTNTRKTAWLTVEQSDLLAGLQAWKEGDPNDPHLMDRVEQLLCGRGSATQEANT